MTRKQPQALPHRKLGSLEVSGKVESPDEDVKDIDDGLRKTGVEGARAPEALLARHDIGANLGTSSTGGHGLSPLPPH